MLLAHDDAGTVVFLLGTNSLHPDGPPDEALPAMFAEVGVDPVGWVRLHDEDDENLVQEVLRRGATVRAGKVVLGDEPPTVEPAPPTSAPVPAVDPALVHAWQDAHTIADLRAAGAELFAALGVPLTPPADPAASIAGA